jgi:hypothetical protein
MQQSTSNVNGKNKKNKTAKLMCSPRVNKEHQFTCFESGTLHLLKQLWNSKHPTNQIRSTNPFHIWTALNEYLKHMCDKESCWLKQKFVNGKLNHEIKNSFAPKSPSEWKKKPNAWLSNLDIDAVMKQYEKTYKCFEFLGSTSIDFDLRKNNSCVCNKLCNFNLADQIKRGKTKIGIVFNTDPHYKGGEHWISLFINIKKRFIYFFDSVGTACPKEIRVFADRVINQGKEMQPPIIFEFDQNHPVSHQNTNTECGVYSLFFIINMLKDNLTKEYLKKHRLKDKYIEKFRKIFFNEEL